MKGYTLDFSLMPVSFIRSKEELDYNSYSLISLLKNSNKLSSFDNAFKFDSLKHSKKQRIDLVIDLDETLVHSTINENGNWNFFIEVIQPFSESVTTSVKKKFELRSYIYFVHLRPHIHYFLDVVSKWYNLSIYTASLREYADQVITKIDRDHKIFKKKLFREDCIDKDGVFLKDISLVNSDLSKICLMDNSLAAFAMYPDNSIPIVSWFGDPKDTMLLDVLPFLDALRFVNDVRSILHLRRMNK